MPLDPRLAELTALSANDFLLDASIRHSLFVQQYGNDVWARALTFLNRDVYPDLLSQVERRLGRMRIGPGTFATKRYADMIRQTNAVIASGFRESRAQLVAQDLLPFARQEAETALSALRNATSVDLNLTGPDPTTLKAIVTARPMQGKFLKDWYDELTSSTQRAVRSQINIGIAQGESIPDMVRRLKGTRAAGYADGILQTSRRNVTAVVRTAVNDVSNAARAATYSANEDIISGVMYVATLDDRTTDICQSLDGQVFPVNEGERPPQHMQCRSTTTPILKNWKDLGLDLKEAPPGTRASMNGQVPASMNYNDWLKTQSVVTQNKILGPNRAKLFQEGTPVTRFVNEAGRRLTLKELAELGLVA